MVSHRHAFGVCLTVLAYWALTGAPGEAHKPITSPYTYNEDVFPIVRDRCGRCHVAGGVAPMSLLSYKDAFPWGESIRTELIAGHMPPGTVDNPSAAIRNGQNLSARELNVLLTWATGGNPVGSPERTPAAVAPRTGWPLGEPDQVVKLPAPVTLDADTQTLTKEFTVPTGTHEERWLRAVDLLPETPAIVRSATIAVKSPSGGADARERVLSLWLPGEDPTALDQASFWLPAGAELSVRVRYKKTWEYERKEMKDQSAIGLYFAAAPARAVRALPLTSPGVSESGAKISFSRVLANDERILAVYPDAALANARLTLSAIRPDGTRTDLLRLRVQADWIRRFWFAQPLDLPKGTRLEGVASLLEQDALVPPGATPIAPRPVDADSARITLDVAGDPK